MAAVRREYLSQISMKGGDDEVHSNACPILTRWNETVTGARVGTVVAVLVAIGEVAQETARGHARNRYPVQGTRPSPYNKRKIYSAER